MLVNLPEVFGTKYFYITFEQDLRYFFNQCISLQNNPNQEVHALTDKMKQVFDEIKSNPKEQIVIDVHGSHFTSDVTEILLQFRSLRFTDLDPEFNWRKLIFEENDTRYKTDAELQTVSLPKLGAEQPLIDYIKSLDSNVVYIVDDFSNELLMTNLVIVIMLTRPEIKICDKSIIRKVLLYVNHLLEDSVIHQYKELYMITPEGVSIVNSDNKIYIQNFGYMPIWDAEKHAKFVPLIFGTKRMSKDNEAFMKLFNTCCDNIEQSRDEIPITIAELFEEK